MRESAKYKYASWLFGGLFVMFATLTMLTLNMWLMPVACVFQAVMMLSASKGERLEGRGR